MSDNIFPFKINAEDDHEVMKLWIKKRPKDITWSDVTARFTSPTEVDFIVYVKPGLSVFETKMRYVGTYKVEFSQELLESIIIRFLKMEAVSEQKVMEIARERARRQYEIDQIFNQKLLDYEKNHKGN